MKITKKNIYSFIGKQCTVKFYLNVYKIVGLNSKGRVLVLPLGETDGIINRIPVYMSHVKLVEEET